MGAGLEATRDDGVRGGDANLAASSSPGLPHRRGFPLSAAACCFLSPSLHVLPASSDRTGHQCLCSILWVGLQRHTLCFSLNITGVQSSIMSPIALCYRTNRCACQLPLHNFQAIHDRLLVCISYNLVLVRMCYILSFQHFKKMY